MRHIAAVLSLVSLGAAPLPASVPDGGLLAAAASAARADGATPVHFYARSADPQALRADIEKLGGRVGTRAGTTRPGRRPALGGPSLSPR